jgi:hypothetical protein
MSNTGQVKYQVFISSTFKDLQPHRQQAELGIVKAGHMPLAIENYNPSSESKRQIIRQALESCQFYVIILGHRYGSVPKDDDRGFVEIELDMAQDLKKQGRIQILPFVMKSELVNKARTTTEFVNSEEIKLVTKYQALRDRLTEGADGPLYKEFETPEEIGVELYAYFKNLQSVRGYILEPEEKTGGKGGEPIIYSKNEVIRNIAIRLSKYEKVEPRFATETDKKQALAKAFSELWGENIRSKFKRVFIESGSTLTYIAGSLARYLPSGGRPASLEVITNNAFAYLSLWLCSGVNCHALPSGSPDDTYAGFYGELSDQYRAPSYDLSPLEDYDPEAVPIIATMKDNIFGHNNKTKDTLILAAISGMQVTNKITAVKVDHEGHEKDILPSDPLIKQLSKCRGFHVGSYQNHLFKRSYYLSEYPAILFVHDKKIDCKIVAGKCHFLCDRNYTWNKLIEKYPLSIWIACDKESCMETLRKFQTELIPGDWIFGIYNIDGDFPIIIGHNSAFRQCCQDINIRLPKWPLPSQEDKVAPLPNEKNTHQRKRAIKRML